MLLGAHPRIATVGEAKVVEWSLCNDEFCSCGARMAECTFWRDVQERLHARGLVLDNGFQAHIRGRQTVADYLVAGEIQCALGEVLRSVALSIWPGASRTLNHLLDCNVALMEAVMEVTGKRIFLDTSKNASRLRYLTKSGYFRVSVIHLIRDGRAAAYSLIRKGVSPQHAAMEWVREHRQAERLQSMLPRDIRWKQVHYERLCADPDATLASLCDFIGIPSPQRSLDFRSWDSHVLGNRLRLGGSSRITLDEKWRTALDGEPLRIVEHVTRDLNQRYGYV